MKTVYVTTHFCNESNAFDTFIRVNETEEKAIELARGDANHELADYVDTGYLVVNEERDENGTFCVSILNTHTTGMLESFDIRKVYIGE